MASGRQSLGKIAGYSGMVVLITGANGTIAGELAGNLRKKEIEVRLLSRNPKGKGQFYWNPELGEIDDAALDGVTHVVHLAGYSIASKRWNKSVKEQILNSRVASAGLLWEKLHRTSVQLEAFISASGVGYYGYSDADVIFTENDPPGTDFLAGVCVQWEKAADKFKDIKGIRIAKLRFGMVLSPEGGSLEKIARPVRWGLGAPLGSGDQWVPWIHQSDLCKFIETALNDTGVTGVYNLVAPSNVTNTEFTSTIAKVLKRPLWLPNVPAFLLRIALGEMSDLVLKGNRVAPERLRRFGFEWEFGSLEAALRDLIRIRRRQ